MQTDDWRAVRVSGDDGLEQALRLGNVDGGMFGIDADEVETAGGHQFGDDGGAGIAPSADHGMAGTESGTEVAHGNVD